MDKIYIGKRIVEARSILGLTQTEFGQKLGVAKQTLANWEHGRSLPDIIMLSLLLNAVWFGLHWFAWLFIEALCAPLLELHWLA